MVAITMAIIRVLTKITTGVDTIITAVMVEMAIKEAITCNSNSTMVDIITSDMVAGTTICITEVTEAVITKVVNITTTKVVVKMNSRSNSLEASWVKTITITIRTTRDKCNIICSKDSNSNSTNSSKISSSVLLYNKSLL